MNNNVPRFGVNYVPSGAWWYAWMDWNGAQIQDDLEQIASLGMDHIRIHCLWHLFQPNPNRTSEIALIRLYELLEIADKCNLDVQITVLDGWLSGFSFFPAWKRPNPEGQGLNLFTDPGMIAAEQFLFSSIAKKIGNHPRFFGFDLGNEVNVLQVFDDAVTLEEADQWQAAMFEHCNLIAPNKFHVNGVDHRPWFSNTGFSRNALGTKGRATAIHMWIEFTGALERYGPNGIGSLHLAEYGIELAKAHHLEIDRMVWLQEFGASKQWMPVDAIPDFTETTIRNALTCSQLWGVTWWCSHDFDADLVGFNPLEYDLGLFDTQNRIKPVGERMSQLIQEFRAAPVSPVTRTTALVVPEGALENSASAWRFATRYFDLIADGVRPALLLHDRRDQQVSREITTIIE